MSNSFDESDRYSNLMSEHEKAMEYIPLLRKEIKQLKQQLSDYKEAYSMAGADRNYYHTGLELLEKYFGLDSL